MAAEAKRITVYGKVQGVYFRANAKKRADHLGLKGFVCNKEDGSVYIEVYGASEKVTAFFDWCKRGPEGAVVQEITITNLAILPIFEGFEIKETLV